MGKKKYSVFGYEIKPSGRTQLDNWKRADKQARRKLSKRVRKWKM